MSALGIAASGAGQGYMQGNQERYGRQQQQRQYGLQERQVGLAEKSQSQEEAFRREQAAREDLARMDSTENSEGFSTKLSPDQQQKIRATNAGRRSRIYRDFPQLSDSAFADKPSPYDDQSTDPGRPAMSTPPIAPTGAPSPFANVQPSTAPDGSTQAVLPEPAGPPAAAPAPTAPTAPVAAQPSVAGPKPNKSLYDFFSAQAHDESLPMEARNAAAAQAMKIRESEAAIAGTEANTAGTLLSNKEIAPNAHMGRAGTAEQIAGSQYDRNTYKPTLLKQGQEQIDLNRLIAKSKSGGGLTASDKIRMMELQRQLNKDAQDRKDQQAERGYQHGKDAATFQQTEDLATRRETAAERNATIGVMAKSVMTVDPITHVPTMKPGGVQEFQRLVASLHQQGKQVTAEDVNPGYPPSVWAKVNEPGMTEQTVRAAVQNALVNGDRSTAILIKNAWAATRMMGGGGAAPAPAAKPAAKARTVAKPTKPTKPQYSYGGGRGEERR
jgi:hypothetical protein